jgi:hypothetical protein
MPQHTEPDSSSLYLGLSHSDELSGALTTRRDFLPPTLRGGNFFDGMKNSKKKFSFFEKCSSDEK